MVRGGHSTQDSVCRPTAFLCEHYTQRQRERERRQSCVGVYTRYSTPRRTRSPLKAALHVFVYVNALLLLAGQYNLYVFFKTYLKRTRPLTVTWLGHSLELRRFQCHISPLLCAQVRTSQFWVALYYIRNRTRVCCVGRERGVSCGGSTWTQRIDWLKSEHNMGEDVCACLVNEF